MEIADSTDSVWICWWIWKLLILKPHKHPWLQLRYRGGLPCFDRDGPSSVRCFVRWRWFSSLASRGRLVIGVQHRIDLPPLRVDRVDSEQRNERR